MVYNIFDGCIKFEKQKFYLKRPMKFHLDIWVKRSHGILKFTRFDIFFIQIFLNYISNNSHKI